MHLDHQLTEQLTRDMVMEKKRIRLGFSMGRTNEMLKEIFPRFYQRYPDIRIYAKAATSRKLMMELHNGALDLAVVTNVEKIPGFIQILVEKSHLVLAVPENSPLLARAVKTEGGLYPMIDPGKLNGIDMVTLPISTNSGSMVKELCERYGIQPRIVLQLSDVRSLMDAVESGLGAALFMSVPSGSKRLRYLTIRGIEEIEQDTVIVLREDKNPTAAMQYLMELIRKEHSIIE